MKKTRNEKDKNIILVELQAVEKERPLVEIIRKKPAKLKPINKPTKRMKELCPDGWSDIEDTGVVDENGYMTIRIDTRAPKQSILDILSEYLDRYGNKGRFRPDGIEDGIEIKRLHEDEGKSLLQIAQERTGIYCNHNYDEGLKNEYEKVKRNYKKVT